jgi:hypothetical protein
VDDAHDGSYPREPQLDDLVRLARALNAHDVRYVLIGGFAVIAHGGARTTKDIDRSVLTRKRRLASRRPADPVARSRCRRCAWERAPAVPWSPRTGLP